MRREGGEKGGGVGTHGEVPDSTEDNSDEYSQKLGPACRWHSRREEVELLYP